VLDLAASLAGLGISADLALDQVTYFVIAIVCPFWNFLRIPFSRERFFAVFSATI
jgi:hypothetical protein